MGEISQIIKLYMDGIWDELEGKNNFIETNEKNQNSNAAEMKKKCKKKKRKNVAKDINESSIKDSNENSMTHSTYDDESDDRIIQDKIENFLKDPNQENFLSVLLTNEFENLYEMEQNENTLTILYRDLKLVIIARLADGHQFSKVLDKCMENIKK